MSNSPLVIHTNLSPNCSKPRNHVIDTITIHCVVGQCSAETLGTIFAPSSQRASSNYGVDKDGRVGMYVEECNRSWCTSSSANDNRAVTIEVASDTTHPYAVTDKALAGLIDLCADICKRNSIKKLLWQADKSLLGQPDKQNMTVHRWYANKACPGDYLYGKHGYIADEVNKRLGTVVATPIVPTPSAASSEEAIWNFLISKGLNAFAVAGLMGNLYAESGLQSNNLQNSYEKSLGYTDATYTAAVDSGKYTNFVKDSAGYGLAQWTYYTRKQALLDYAKSAKKSIGDLTTQLEFLWKELQGYSGVMTVLKAAKSVAEASNVVLLQFERPADQSAAAQSKRAGYGQPYYTKYAAKTAVTPTTPAAFIPYTVRITASALNYRKGAGTNFAVAGTVKKSEVYTIVEESAGTGATKWGKLKSGAGWLSLDYTTKA
jgi:hypothetical protein